MRYDGRHKRDDFLLAALGGAAGWVPVCPEFHGLGLGAPRPPMHLAGPPQTPRLIVTATGRDLTAPMNAWARAHARRLAESGVDGCVLKARSPSCEPGERPGLFALALRRVRPALPLISEEGFGDPLARLGFLLGVMIKGDERREGPAARARHRLARRFLAAPRLDLVALGAAFGPACQGPALASALAAFARGLSPFRAVQAAARVSSPFDQSLFAPHPFFEIH